MNNSKYQASASEDMSEPTSPAKTQPTFKRPIVYVLVVLLLLNLFISLFTLVGSGINWSHDASPSLDKSMEDMASPAGKYRLNPNPNPIINRLDALETAMAPLLGFSK